MPQSIRTLADVHGCTNHPVDVSVDSMNRIRRIRSRCTPRHIAVLLIENRAVRDRSNVPTALFSGAFVLLIEIRVFANE